MKNKVVILLLSSIFFFVPVSVMAGTGHDHGHSHETISRSDVQSKAMDKVRQLANAGKIDLNWINIQPSSTEQKVYEHGPEWMIIFKNDKVSDSSKQTLYMFYSLDGHYIAANYDGS